MVSSTALECGKELKEIAMLENGSLEKPMDMVYIPGSMETGIKANLNSVSNTEKDYNDL
jgi:hypothetical protein